VIAVDEELREEISENIDYKFREYGWDWDTFITDAKYNFDLDGRKLIIEKMYNSDCEHEKFNPLIPELCSVVNDDDFSIKIRRKAAITLGHLYANEAVDSLSTALEDKDEILRIKAAISLGFIGDSLGISTLIDALDDNSYDVTQAAENALLKYCTQSHIEYLLNEDNPNRISTLVAILYNQYDFDAETYMPLIPLLCKSLIEETEFQLLRVNAAKFLGKLKSKEAVDPLIKTLGDYDPELRTAAATSLGLINDLKAVDALIEAINDVDPNVQYAANMALRKFNFDLLANINETTTDANQKLEQFNEKLSRNEVNENDYLELQGTEVLLKRAKDYAISMGNERYIHELTHLITAISKLRPSNQTSITDSVVNKSSLGEDENIVTALRELGDMKKDGLINNEEFEIAKRRLLTENNNGEPG